MAQDAKWVDDVIAAWPKDAGVPEVCEQPRCQRSVETWCPLCERFLCAAHDPVPRHDCLRGPVGSAA